MNKSVVDALNQQIGAEFFSAYLYLAMAAWFAQEGLNGFAHWMRIQAGEEKEHALKIFDYLHERGERAALKEIAAPAHAWASPLEAFKEAAQHERKVTQSIHNLVELSAKEKDHATGEFLRWYVTEQVEEEAQADEIVKKLSSIKPDSGLVYFFDKELGSRQAD